MILYTIYHTHKNSLFKLLRENALNVVSNLWALQGKMENAIFPQGHTRTAYIQFDLYQSSNS